MLALQLILFDIVMVHDLKEKLLIVSFAARTVNDCHYAICSTMRRIVMLRLKESLLFAIVSLVVTVMWSVSSAHGSGFGVFTHGASALGQADAVVAHTDGPSAIFFNPALINKLAGTQVELGTTLIFPSRDFTAPDGSTATTRDKLFYPSTFYLTHAFNDKVSAGLGVFNPFGLSTDWGSDWQGRFITTKSELQTFDFRPVVSYRLTPYLAVAAGVDFVLLDATLERKIPTPLGEVGQKFTGDGNGIGYNLGIAVDAGKGITFGASYRSEVKIDINGNAAFTLPSPLLSATFPNTGATTSITLPQQVFAGIAYQPTDRLVVEAGMRWEDWRSFDQLQIAFAQPVAGLSSVTFPRDWHETFAVNAGGKYRLNDTISLLAGYLFGWNPVPDSTFEPAITGSDSHLFSVGGEARFDRLSVTLAYAYQLFEERTKTTNLYGPIANGTYNSDLHLLGLSFGYRFR
jgi:long-chain fatty acid transport protein